MPSKKERSDDFLNKIQQFLDKFPDGHLVLNNKGMFIAFNDQAEKILGVDRKALIKKHYSKASLFKNTDSKTIKKQFDSVYKQNRKKVIQYELLPLPGKSRVITLSLVPIKFDKMNMVLGSVDDVTARYELLEEVTVSRDLAEQYLQIAGVLIMGLNKKGEITMINDVGAKALGGTKDEIIGMNWFKNFIPKSDQIETKKTFDKILSTKKTKKILKENTIVDLNGIQKHFRWYNALVKNQEGVVTGVLSSGHDITETLDQFKKIELYKTGFKSSPNSVLLVSYKNSIPVIEEVNPGFTNMYGYTSKEAIGKNPRILNSGIVNAPTYQMMWSDILNPSKGFWTGELVNKRKDGEYINVILTINTVFDDQNVPQYFLAHHVDISEEVKNSKQIQQLDTLKSRFITSITHVTRTPLTKLRWSLESLITGEAVVRLDANSQLLIKEALKNTQEINNLIRDMNLAIDIERGALNFTTEFTSISQLVRSVITENEKRFAHKKLGLSRSIKECSLINFDPKKIRLVVNTLLENAFMYSRKGTVKITLSESKSMVTLKVADEGIGIPLSEQSLIFTNFFRASNASTINPDGVGIQLANAKQIIDLHNGKLSFISHPEEGTIFTMKLPKTLQKRMKKST